jgi:hypothetical protein
VPTTPVVSNTSPLINLVGLGLLRLLPRPLQHLQHAPHQRAINRVQARRQRGSGWRIMLCARATP